MLLKQDKRGPELDLDYTGWMCETLTLSWI